MSHLQFFRATLSRDKLAARTKLCMSHTATLSHKQDMTNQLGQCLFMRQSCIVHHAQLRAATLLCDKVVRQNRVIKSQV